MKVYGEAQGRVPLTLISILYNFEPQKWGEFHAVFFSVKKTMSYTPKKYCTCILSHNNVKINNNCSVSHSVLPGQVPLHPYHHPAAAVPVPPSVSGLNKPCSPRAPDPLHGQLEAAQNWHLGND
jgi:hypothetical protein